MASTSGLSQAAVALGIKHATPCHLRQPVQPFTARRRHASILQRLKPICGAAQVSTDTTTPPGLSTEPWLGTPEQEQALAEVSARMEGYFHGTPDLETQRWFLRDRKFNIDAAVEKLEAMMRWRDEFNVDQITEQTVATEFASGKAYLAEHRDVNNRPAIVIRVERHVTGEYSLDDSKRLCVHLLEKAIAALPEGRETLVGVFDLQNFGNKNADLGFVRFLVDIFFTYYPKRLGQVLMVDAPWIFSPGWKLVRPWLRKYAALVRFVSREELAREFFTPETLPPDFK